MVGLVFLTESLRLIKSIVASKTFYFFSSFSLFFLFLLLFLLDVDTVFVQSNFCILCNMVCIYGNEHENISKGR